MAFRIGRKHAQHTYPENARAAAVGAFARNSALGPLTDLLLDDILGSPITWSIIESSGAAGIDVPITPRVSGIVRVSGVFSLSSASEVEEFVTVKALVNVGAGPVLYGIPVLERVTIDAGGFAVIPFLIQVPIPVGTEGFVRIALFPDTPSELTVVAGSSTLDLQEVVAATG